MSAVEPLELDADALLRVLVEHRVEFVVIGGLAVAAHGYIRGTKDIDIVPNPARENLALLYDALVALDAEPIETGDFRQEEMPVALDVEGLAHGGNWALRTSRGRLDILQWATGIESYDALHSRAVELELPGVGRVLFAGYGDLVAMKEAAGRPQDHEDLQRLREARGLEE